MKSIAISLSALLFVLVSVPSQASFEGTYTLVVEKQEEKKRQRWTLDSWLQTKQKIKLMDNWLALHSADTVFEAFLGGTYSLYGKKIDGVDILDAGSKDFKDISGQLGFYYSIFGLEGQYTEADDYKYSLHLRLLGTGIQNSNITLFYGVDRRNELLSSVKNIFENQFFGTSLKIYIFDFFGLEGNYKKYLAKASDQGIDLEGSSYTAGAFLDISFISLFAQIFQEKFDLVNAGVPSELQRLGYRAGLNLYF